MLMKLTSGLGDNIFNLVFKLTFDIITALDKKVSLGVMRTKTYFANLLSILFLLKQ